MKSKKLICIISFVCFAVLIPLTINSCGKSTKSDETPSPETLAEPQPRAAAPVPPELLPATETFLSTDEPLKMTKQPAKFDTIEIIDPTGSPKLRLTGYLPDGASKLEEPEFNSENGILFITINTERDPEAIATMAIVPFDITIDLPSPLPAQILLNGLPIVASPDT